MIKKLLKWWRDYKCRNDLHNYNDDKEMNFPCHFYYHTCKHCNKLFKD